MKKLKDASKHDWHPTKMADSRTSGDVCRRCGLVRRPMGLAYGFLGRQTGGLVMGSMDCVHPKLLVCEPPGDAT